MPASVDFPLYPGDEPAVFRAILFGDTQPRNQKEIDYIAHDVIEELIGAEASFGITLGDVMFNNLSLFGSLNRAIALIGIPWYNVIGNHDLNFDSPGTSYALALLSQQEGTERARIQLLEGCCPIASRAKQRGAGVQGNANRFQNDVTFSPGSR